MRREVRVELTRNDLLDGAAGTLRVNQIDGPPSGVARTEVVALVEVFEQAGPRRLPAEEFPSQGGRRRTVQGSEVAQGGEVLYGIVGATDTVGISRWQPNGFGDVTKRDAFVAHRMENRPGRRGFDGQPSEPSSIGAMDGGPTIHALADGSRDAFLPGDIHKGGHEPVITVAVHRRRKAQYRRTDSDASE